MYGGAAVWSTSRTQYCVTLSTTEAEYVAMAEGEKECMFVRSVLSFLQPRLVLGRGVEYDIFLYEDNEGAKALAESPLSSSRSKYVDVRWNFFYLHLFLVEGNVPIKIRSRPPRPGGVEVRRPPLGGKNEGSIPVELGFFLRSV